MNTVSSIILRVFGFEFFHECDQFFQHLLLRHGIVDAGTHAADGAVSFEADKPICIGFLDE